MFYFMLFTGFLFAYLNGMHDGGTVVATTISSRLIPPAKAVFYAGISNFLGALVLGTAVAYTISKDVVDVSSLIHNNKGICYSFIAASFLGSIVWNLLTWVIKLPSSASHSMIGAMIGSGAAAYGLVYIQWKSIFFKIILAMLISPLLGFIMGFIIWKLQNLLLKNATILWNSKIIFLHKISNFLLSFCYGSNDSQKVMGLIAIGLACRHGTDITIPMWLMISCSAVLAFGTITGGYNMIKTIGMDICKINIDRSFASQMATIFVVAIANVTGLPISTTQVITSSVMGVGTGDTPKSVNWTVSKKILIAWIVTIPASSAIGALMFMLLMMI